MPGSGAYVAHAKNGMCSVAMRISPWVFFSKKFWGTLFASPMVVEAREPAYFFFLAAFFVAFFAAFLVAIVFYSPF